MAVQPNELAEFQKEVRAWFKDNDPGNPGFLLPETFMEVGEDRQLRHARRPA